MNESEVISAKPGFEGALDQLQQTVKKLEGGELSLEQSLLLFEQGIKLTRLCQEQLGAAEQKVEQLMKVGSDGKADLQPFASPRT